VVVIRIIKAELFRSFDVVGNMDPFAVLEYLPSGHEETKIEIGRTKSDWQAHMHPVWNHCCRGAIYRGPGSGDSLRLRVLEENFGGLGMPTFCGEVTAGLEELLADVAEVSAGVKTSQPRDLKLVKRGENTGTITVQVVLHLAPSRHTRTIDISALTGMEQPMTLVDPDLFETPVQRLGVSGGTAPFFALRLRSPKAGQTEDHWIGKDLSRATDEISFYEQRMALAKAGNHGMEKLFSFMFDYAGVLECAEAGVPSDAPKLQLLVLRNLRDSCKSFRMLDIKVGEKTAAPGWQGKSWFSAMKQSVVDGLTNSHAEGFRLEGFDGQPPALQSMDPLLDFGGVAGIGGKAVGKKAKRLMMQRMPATEIFAHLMDVHQEPPDVEDVNASFTPTELAEIFMDEMTRQLVQLVCACKAAPVPQKWIGSSVALGFDSGHLPLRGTSLEGVARTIRVQIFDWGRSELNTLEHHVAMAAEEQADRLLYWKYYCGGIMRLAWEAARFYWHRFCNISGWTELLIQVYDFDSHSSNDFIGQVHLPLAECPETTEVLKGEDGAVVCGKSGPSQISYAISWRTLPEGSRLRGAWRVQLLRAQNLPGLNGIHGRTSDPFVSILAKSADGLFQCQQSSCVIAGTVDPTWNEVFEFPVAVEPPPMLVSLLQRSKVEAHFAFPPADGPTAPQEDHAVARVQWEEALNKARGRQSFLWA